MLANVGRITQAPAILDPQVAALAPAQLLQRLLERRELGTAGAATAREHADPPYAPWLLRARPERPRGRRAAEQRDELAASCVEHGLPSRKPLCQLTAGSGCLGSARRSLEET